MKSIYELAAELEKGNRKGAVCTVVKTHGSTPRKQGAKMIVLENGSIAGTIGGGDLEKNVIELAKSVIINKIPLLSRHDLLSQHGMCCGGSVEIYIEPIMAKNKLYIFGAGHTGHALARHALDLDFDIYLIDDRQAYMDAISLDEVSKMCINYSMALEALTFDENTYIAILTYSHQIDKEILAFCLQKPHAYLGMIGSQRKVKTTQKQFMESKIADEHMLSGIDMPMGIDINAESPEEIAISIIARLIKTKNTFVEK